MLAYFFFFKSSLSFSWLILGGHHLETFNAFGDHQLDTDIDCEEAMIEELKKTGLIKYVLTEENPSVIKWFSYSYSAHSPKT